MQFNPITGPAAFTDHLGQCRTKPLSDALHFEKPACGDQFAQIFGQRTEHSACVLVGSNPEHIRTLEFQKYGNLVQGICDLISRKVGWATRSWFWE